MCWLKMLFISVLSCVSWSVTSWLKASFWGLFRTNFCGHFHKPFLFTKFKFSNFREKASLTVLRSMCLEFYASNYYKYDHCAWGRGGVLDKYPESLLIPKSVVGNHWVTLFGFLVFKRKKLKKKEKKSFFFYKSI